jgi:hypothetical protein
MTRQTGKSALAVTVSSCAFGRRPAVEKVKKILTLIDVTPGRFQLLFISDLTEAKKIGRMDERQFSIGRIDLADKVPKATHDFALRIDLYSIMRLS